MTPKADIRVQEKKRHLIPQPEGRNRVPAVARSIEDRYRILLDASSAVADQATVNDVLRTLRSVLSNICCVYSAGLYLFTEGRKGLKLFAYDRDADGIAVPIGTQVPCTEAFARAVETQQPVYLPDVAQEMRKFQELAPFASRIGVRRAYLFPVATSRKQYGVVAFTSEQGRVFSADDVELMGSLALHVAVAVENWAYQQQLTEERDRVRASRDELQRSEAYLAEAQRLSHTGSFAFDVTSNKYVYMSEECLGIFEFDAQQALPSREALSQFIHAEDWDRVRGDFDKLLRDKVDIPTDFRVVLPSGRLKYLRTIRHPVLNDGGDVVQVVGTVMDITERTQREHALRESEMRFRAFVDHAADAFCIFDEQHKIVEANWEACQSLGYTREELIGMVPQDFDPDVDAAKLQWIDDQVAAGKVCTFETRNRRKDGTVLPVEVRIRRYQSGGRLFHLASSRNISERKRAEEERRAASERFRAIADYTYDWENWIGADGKLLWVNPAVERITGYSVDDCMAMSDFPMPIIAEADRQTVAQQMREAVEGSSGNDFEFRVRHKDGHMAWVAASWQPIYDSHGATLGYRSSMRDIGERKRMEEALRRSESYLAEAERLSHTASWAWDPANLKTSYWSAEMYRIFGLKPQDVPPTPEVFWERIHPEDLEQMHQLNTSLSRVGHDYQHEHRIVLPDGTVKYIHAIGHPVFDQSGRLIEYVGTAIDITQRKQAEKALRESKAQLAQERDRLSLLLEISNYITSKLEVDELFDAVSASMRKHLGCDATSFWLINKDSGCLERKYIDFPSGAGFLKQINVVIPGNLESAWWRTRAPQFYSIQKTPDLPPALRDAFEAESLVSLISVPLVGTSGPLGFINISSRKADAFREADRDLLSQIGDQISLALENALAYGCMRASRDHLEDQRIYLESEISSEYSFEDIVGKSSAIKRVLQQLAVVAPTDSTILLHGETGTGKELMARAIHNLSSRRECSFVRMNCAAIPSGLLESELFGHEKGAFTGALMQRRGRFELADHGTLFLDEIGDISLELQPKLLRAVQEQEFERLGSAKTIHVDVRIIAATHRDLAAMIRQGKFREDLFYRLNVFPIQIPPLRERREDIPLLVNYFVAKLSRRIGKKIKSISRETMDILTKNPWPGNVRELANVLERAVILTQGDQLELPIPELHPSSVGRVGAPMVATVQEAERAMIMEALRASGGRISGEQGAAKRLGLKRTTLQHKMHRLGIKPILNIAGAALPKVGIPDKQ